MIGEKTEEEADEPTRMFTGDIGDFIKKKREYEDVPEEDAYEEIPSVNGESKNAK